MYNNLHSRESKQLVLKIPATILSNTALSFNEKLILSLDYTYQSKKGYTKLSNSKIGKLFNLHVNIISKARRNLVLKVFLSKDKYMEFEVDDKREVYLPYEIYNHKELSTGAKLLWGEFNSISKGRREYFAKRCYTSKRLSASVESVTNWTKQLQKHQLLKSYRHRTGYCTSQRVVVTCEFIEGEKILDITYIQNPKGEWVRRRAKMLGFEEWE